MYAYLNRVAPKDVSVNSNSGEGIFSIVGPEFICQALNDKDNLDNLRQHLSNYSGTNKWSFQMDIHQDAQLVNNDQAVEKKVEATISQAQVSYVPGSFEGDNQKRRLERIKKIEKDAKEDKMVKEALSVFQGAVIEKVTPIIKNKS